MNQSRVGVSVSEPRSWVNAEEKETKTDWPWQAMCANFTCVGAGGGAAWLDLN